MSHTPGKNDAKTTTRNAATAAPKTFLLGGELNVHRLGFGAMRLTGQPGNFGPYEDWQGGLDLLRHAAELGVDFFDSAGAYGPFWADRLLGEAFEGLHDVVIATKGGIHKPEPGRILVDGSPATLALQIDQALQNLRVERLDLFQLHRVDPETPIEDSVAALDRARKAGKVRFIGLSNVDRTQLDRALAVAPIASVQNRFNQSEQGDSDLVDYTARRGIAFIPYGPLGAHPMRRGAMLQPREALAWLLDRSPNLIVIPGTTSIPHLEENVSAWNAVGGLAG